MDNNYSVVLGHEPTDRTRQTLERLEAMAQKMHEENPELTNQEIWEILYEAAQAVIAKRGKPATD